MTRKRRLSFASVLALATAVLLLTTAVVCVADVRNAYADDAAASVSVWDGTSDTSCYSFATNEIVINSAAQLRGIADMSNNGFDFSPYTIRLNTDIDLDGKEWIPFTNYGGVFDGQGHTISNGNIKASDSDGTGFFGRLDKVTTIKDLVFKKMTTRSDTFLKLAIVAGANSANGTTFKNVDLYNCFVTGNPDYVANAGGFYLCDSTGAIKIEDCDVYFGVYRSKQSNGIAASINGEYQSKIVNCNVVGTFLISSYAPGVFIGNGNDNTVVENCHSDLYPTEIISISGIENEFTDEQKQLIADNASTLARGIAYTCYYKSVNSGSLLESATLDSTDISSNLLNADTYVDANSFNSFSIKFGTADEIVVSIDGNEQTVASNEFSTTLNEGVHDISVVLKKGSFRKAYKLLVGFDKLFAIYDSNGNTVAQKGLTAIVSSCGSGYTLKQIATSQYVSFTVNGSAIASDGVALTNRGGDLGYYITISATYNGVKYDISCSVLKYGVTISGNWNYNQDGSYFVSSNIGQDNTTSEMIFTVEPGVKLTFDYNWSSENNYDWFNIEAPGATNVRQSGNDSYNTVQKVLAATNWQKYEYTNTSSSAVTVRVYFTKDGGASAGCDAGFVRNITYESTSSQSLDKNNYAIASADSETVYTIPTDAVQLNDYVYYVLDGCKYDTDKNHFINESGNQTITFYIKDCAVFSFKYAIEGTSYDMTVTGDDSITTTLYGTGGLQDDKVKECSMLFETNAVHKIVAKFNGPTYYYFNIKNVTAAPLLDYNINVEIEGNGTVFDIANFDNIQYVGACIRQTYNKLQFFGRTDVNSASEFVGYQIKNADGTWGELIKSNGDVFTVVGDMDFKFVFADRLSVENEISYSLITNGVATNGKLRNYEKITFDKVWSNTQLVLTAPIMNGVTAKVYDSIKGTEEELQIDNNAYFYTIDDVSASRTIKFIYEKEGYVTTEFVVFVAFEADINSYIIAKGSKTIEVINDDDLNYQYNSSLSTSERFAYASSLSKKNMFNSASNIGFRVQGQGILVFDYYINSEDRGETEASNTLHTGDRALYGINTRITWDEVTNGYSTNPAGYIKDSYKDRVGYLGAALGTVDFSKCQGQLGWQRVSIPVVASSDDEYNTVYIAYVKDWEDTIETEDTFAIANVMFVQGNFNVSFNTNTSTGSVSATANGSQITSGQSVGAGSLITLTATDSDSSARFVGWYTDQDKLISKNRTINFGLGNEINYQAVFANSQNPYVVNNKTFATLSNAVSSIGSEQGLVRLLANAQEDDINVPSNVTLLLVYSADDEEGLLVGGGNTRVSWNCGVDPYVTLTVNGKLTINGKLIVGGVQHKADQSAQGHTSGDYAQMIVNGSVEIANGGYLDVIGRVTGNGTITAKDGATLRQPFTVNNYAGGTNTYALYDANQFPFVQFATINVECDQVVEYGAKVIGSTSLYFWSSITTQDVVLIDKIGNRTADGEGALIWMQEGSSLEISYDSSKSIDSKVGNIHLGDFGVTTIDVYGNITAGEFYLQNYGSGAMVLAIPYTYNFNIKSGAKVTIDQAYKIMPGAIVTIDNGATVNITENGTLYVYDGLYQSSKNGKRYPYYDELADNGFAKSGMLIVNGTFNINGTFAGIAQTVEGGEINVGENANVANQPIVEGCNGGYDYNMATFEMSGRVYGVNGYVSLEKGKTYRTFANNAFTLDSFTNKYWVGTSDSSSEGKFEVNPKQAMQGRFAEWNGEKFVLTLTFYIGTETKEERAYVTINGMPYVTDIYGKFTCTVEVASATEAIKYFTTNKYTAVQSHQITFDGVQNLERVTSYVDTNNGNVRTRVYDKDGRLVQDFDLKGIVHFYGTTDTEEITLSFDESALDGIVYAKYVALGNEYVKVGLTTLLCVKPQEVSKYIDDVENLKNAEDIIAQAKALYEKYNELVSKGDETDIMICTDWLRGKQDYALLPIGIAGASTEEGEETVYGYLQTLANLNRVDGTSGVGTAQIVENSWRFEGGKILVDVKVTCRYQGKEYTLTGTINANPKAVTIKDITTADSAVYDGAMHTVTATLSGLADFDNDTLVYATATFGKNAGKYNVTFKLAGDKAAFYTLTGDTAHTCTITAKDITVTVNDAQAIVDKTDTIVLVANASGNVDEIAFTFAIYKGETLVATVGKDGKVTLADGQTLEMGEYTVKAVTDNANYNIASQTEGTLKVVEANDYYDVDFDLGGTSKVYDGNVLAVNPTVKVKATGELVDASKYTVSVKLNNVDAQIVNAGTYQITVTLDGEIIAQENYIVTAKDVTVTIKPQSSVYGEDISVDQIAYTASGVIGNDDLKVTLTIDNSARNAGKYDIVGAWNNHNYNVTFAGGEKAYEITAKAIVVEIEDKESFYGEKDAVLSAKLKGSLAYTDSFDSLGIKLVRAAGKNAGTYAITLDSWTNENYTITAENAEYTVKKLALRAIVANATSVYGDPLANLTFTIEGKFAEGESVDVLNAKLSIGNAKNAGTYGIEFAYDNANYDVSATNATYTITKRDVTLLVQDATSVYGDSDAALVVSITKGTMAYGEDAQSLVSITRAEGRVVGTYAITATKADNANYDVTLVYTGATNSVYTITKRPVTVTVKNAELAYTASWAELNSALRYESNVLAGDELNVRLFVLVGGVELTADNFGSMFAGGTHVISASIDNGNYELTVVNGALTVGLPVVSLTDAARGITRVYGDTQNVFNWRTMLTGYLASATDSTFRAVFYRASDLTTPVDIATAGAGAYKMQIEIVHATAYSFAGEKSKSEFVDVTVEKKDLTDSIVITLSGLTDGGYLVFSYGLSIDASVTGHDDIEIVKVLTKDGAALDEIDSVGAYEYTATIQSANYKGAKTLRFKVVNSAEGKIEGLRKYAGVEFLTRAQYAEAKALLEGITEDDTLQINDDAEAKANYANVEALCANYAKVAANLDEIKSMLDAYAEGESKKLIEAHDYIVALDEEKLALVKQSEEGKAYQEAWQAARAEGAEATEIANKVRDNVLFGVVAAVSALLAMAYVALGKFRV